MKKVRRSRTAPEEAVAEILRELGVRSRRNVRGLPGTPDFANKRRQFAIFVHGCFWHGHSPCPLAKIPKTNRDFWMAKLRANKRRDIAKVQALEGVGFMVVTVWQCELTAIARWKLKRLARRSSRR